MDIEISLKSLIRLVGGEGKDKLVTSFFDSERCVVFDPNTGVESKAVFDPNTMVQLHEFSDIDPELRKVVVDKVIKVRKDIVREFLSGNNLKPIIGDIVLKGGQVFGNSSREIVKVLHAEPYENTMFELKSGDVVNVREVTSVFAGEQKNNTLKVLISKGEPLDEFILPIFKK